MKRDQAAIRMFVRDQMNIGIATDQDIARSEISPSDGTDAAATDLAVGRFGRDTVNHTYPTNRTNMIVDGGALTGSPADHHQLIPI